MPGYQFSVSMILENPQNKELVVRIPRGSLIEPLSTARTQQSAAISKDYVFRLNPKETRPVILEAECWNPHLTPPKMAPGKITPFVGKIHETTNVWGVSATSAAGTPTVSPAAKSSISHAIAAVGDDWAIDAFEYMINKITR